LLCCLAYLLAALSPATLQRAAQLQGERWYKLELDKQQVGYLHSRSWQDHAGHWQFSTDLRFVLAPGQPVTILNSLTFSGDAPYTLISAEHENRRRGQMERVAIAGTADGYQARVESNQTRAAHTAALQWTYSLDDYLTFENWLHAEQPSVGATKTVPTLDLERLQVINKNHRVVDRNGLGYTVENAAPQNPTRIQLDADYAPVSLEMAGLFSLTRTSADQALAPRTALQSGSYHIPTDQALSNHTQIQRMVLRVESDGDLSAIWPQLEPQEDGWRLTLHANPVSAGDSDGHTEETAIFPTSSLRIRRLATRAVADANDPTTRLASLTSFVNDFITYQPGATQKSVLALLEHPVGDCTEFADLFTTLARALEIPARTVFGMAYANDGEPAFAFHAWNEVLVDGNWQAVDPTWNQVRVDATHIPLPGSGATLKLITGAPDLRFSVEEVEYFSL
jgi:hypothetical protein